jgi:hypothetical protein
MKFKIRKQLRATSKYQNGDWSYGGSKLIYSTLVLLSDDKTYQGIGSEFESFNQAEAFAKDYKEAFEEKELVI